ncbi:hypothetical protein HOD38_04535 [archaeon]|jgi:hypothetical protein|nr:hypothetical protein [archaeon]MBT4397509.1 hypothetical protein [archaeon]MBT4440859.1 hypothetical protein [archaeon]
MSDLVRIFESYVATNNDKEVEEYLEEHNICSFYDIDRLPKYKRSLIKLLGVDKRVKDIRKELFRRNYLTELPLIETIKALTSPGSVPLYFVPETVGEEMVEHYRRIVAESESFHNWLYERYISLTHLGSVTGALAFVMGIPTGLTTKETRKVAFENGFLREMPPEDALRYGEKKRWPYVYFDPETVGAENAEMYRVEFEALQSEDRRRRLSHIMFP